MNTTTPWIKSTRSGGNGGQCVEVRRADAVIEVRDSKAPDGGPILRFAPGEFTAFLRGVKHGTFDHLAG
jgi:hypothetical protein